MARILMEVAPLLKVSSADEAPPLVATSADEAPPLVATSADDAPPLVTGVPVLAARVLSFAEGSRKAARALGGGVGTAKEFSKPVVANRGGKGSPSVDAPPVQCANCKGEKEVPGFYSMACTRYIPTKNSLRWALPVEPKEARYRLRRQPSANGPYPRTHSRAVPSPGHRAARQSGVRPSASLPYACGPA